MKITRCREYKGDTFELVLDGEKKIFINAQVVSDQGLYEGMELTSAQLAEITNSDILRKAKKRALYLLGARDYCGGELRSRLAKTYNERIADEAVAYVKDLGYINDERYAEKLASYLIQVKKRGVRRARQEMLCKGLSRELCDNALGEFSREELDEELTALIRKKYAGKLSDFDSRRKTVAALARQGWDLESIKRGIEACVRTEDEEFDEYED